MLVHHGPIYQFLEISQHWNQGNKESFISVLGFRTHSAMARAFAYAP
jgi:hypothetical protein